MGKYVWEMLGTSSHSWNFTRKFYSEETWFTRRVNPFFFSSNDNIQVFHSTLCPWTGARLLNSGLCLPLDHCAILSQPLNRPPPPAK